MSINYEVATGSNSGQGGSEGSIEALNIVMSANTVNALPDQSQTVPPLEKSWRDYMDTVPMEYSEHRGVDQSLPVRSPRAFMLAIVLDDPWDKWVATVPMEYSEHRGVDQSLPLRHPILPKRYK